MKTEKSLLKVLRASEKIIAKERDKLRAIMDEYEQLMDCCDRAHEDIQNAIDSLSELV